MTPNQSDSVHAIRNTHHAPHHVAIIGGGLTGLSTAWYLQKQIDEQNFPLRYTILERTNRSGGKIQTDRVDGYGNHPFVIERAGDAFLAAQKPWAMELAHELGLHDQILPTNDAERTVYIVKDGHLVPLPAGLQLIVPTNPEALLASPLLSEAGKKRMLAEGEVAARISSEDESVAEFVRRRFGPEALEIFAEPLLSGIYNASPEVQSIHATFPRFPAMEREHGSLLAAVQAAQTARQSTTPLHSKSKSQALSAFISFVGGTEVLTHELSRRLRDSLHLNSGIDRIERATSGRYSLQTATDSPRYADSVVVTTPAEPAAQLLCTLVPTASHRLRQLRTVSTGVLFLAYRKQDIHHPLNGFGVVIPRREARPINAMTWMTTKFQQRAPMDYVLLRIFFGGVRSPQMMQVDDADVVQTAQAELSALMGIDATPLFHRIYRWRNAQPQYDVGHLDRMKTIDAALPENVYLAGSPYRGVGIPDCVRQGKEVAERIGAAVKSQT
ncbi:protoporphyrinogen oxidase [Chloroflexi bacterium TSY]|nr:protoporphyrinogen oxidase [Chloroflexi bacterium TSY]